MATEQVAVQFSQFIIAYPPLLCHLVKPNIRRHRSPQQFRISLRTQIETNRHGEKEKTDQNMQETLILQD